MDASHMIRKTLIFLATIVAGISIAAAQDPREAPVEIVSAAFGIFDASGPDELILAPTKVVPLKVGQRYGWVIEVRTGKRSLAVRDEYLLPARSKVQLPADPLSESLSMPAMRRRLISQRQLVPKQGKIYGEWTVGANDSASHRILQVFIEGQLGPRFEYDIE